MDRFLPRSVRYRSLMPEHRHSHHLPAAEPDPIDFLMQVVVPPSPDSATRGDIVITVLERAVDEWAGVWRLNTGESDGEWPRISELGSRFGSRAELVGWAMEQDAASRWVFDEETSSFVPLT